MKQILLVLAFLFPFGLYAESHSVKDDVDSITSGDGSKSGVKLSDDDPAKFEAKEKQKLKEKVEGTEKTEKSDEKGSEKKADNKSDSKSDSKSDNHESESKNAASANKPTNVTQNKTTQSDHWTEADVTPWKDSLDTVRNFNSELETHTGEQP